MELDAGFPFPGTKEELRQTVSTRFAALLAGDHQQRLRAAGELIELSVRLRGTIRVRGGLRQASRQPQETPPELERATNLLADADHNLRVLVALVIGEWGSEASASHLEIRLGQEADETVRIALLTALKHISGVAAVKALARSVEHDPSTRVRFAALSGLEELAAGGWAEGTDRPLTPQPSVRLRGRRSGRAKDADGLAGVLSGIRGDKAAPDFLREKAGDVLAYIRGRDLI